MNLKIKEMTGADRECVMEMMRTFYASPAVHTQGSEEIFFADTDACIGNSPYLEGYVFEHDGETVGYSMLAKSFSTEFGKPCIWIEDIYFIPEARGMGYAGIFFKMIEEKHKGSILRLEVDADNENALRAYRKSGFEVMPYIELKKDVR